ncbi:MAG: hypothetical protein RM368_33110 [Nostoc sp. DedSLP03]|nr:hypothetical protein [Nostoc sp. DedSLP03]MDZ7969731.1 hypothetical protein [Nostoc sp. DedSLP03]
MSDNKDFWTTALGLITAVVGLMTTSLALLSFLQTIGVPVGYRAEI